MTATTTRTDDLETRRSNLSAHIEGLTSSRDAALAALAQIEAEHRDAATAGDPARTAKAVGDRHTHRSTLADAETDLATAQGWLAETMAAIASRDAAAAAEVARVEADAAVGKFSDVLADVTGAIEDRVTAVAAAVEAQQADFARLRQAIDAAQGARNRVRALTGEPLADFDPVERALDVALRESEALTRGWRVGRVLHPGPMLNALVETIRSTRVEFRR